MKKICFSIFIFVVFNVFANNDLFVEYNKSSIIFLKIESNEVIEYPPIIIKPKNPYEEYDYETPKEIVPMYDNLRLIIDFSKFDHKNTFHINEVIGLKCEIINITNIDEEIYLKDHDDYHGTLSYPTSIFITIEDEHGEKIIDEHTDYVYWSTFFSEMPGDWILLRYNEKVTRKFSINKIMGRHLNIFNIGKYYIIISLKYLDKNKIQKKYVSNKLELNIIE